MDFSAQTDHPQFHQVKKQGTVCVTDAKDNELEVLWQQTYEQCKLIAKNIFMNKPCQNHNDVVPTTVGTGLVEGMNIDNESTAVHHELTENEYDFDNHFSPANGIVEGNMMLNLKHDVDIGTVLKNWNLKA